VQHVLNNFWPILVLHAFVDVVLFVSYRVLHRILNQGKPLHPSCPSLTLHLTLMMVSHNVFFAQAESMFFLYITSTPCEMAWIH